jgi:hypothetical protein
VRVLTPASNERWSFPVSLLLGVEYQTWRQLLSVRSAVVVLLEVLCLLPLLLLADALRARAGEGATAYPDAEAQSSGRASR